MSLNPRDYDLDELRKMARERGGTAGSDVEEPNLEMGNLNQESRQQSAPSSLRASLYRELLPLEVGADAEKPYLAQLPEEYAGEHLVFEWLEFLLLHAGYKGTMDALSYYESVDWITEDCRSTLHDYILGLEADATNDPATLDVDDHLLSLVYIGKLRAMG